MYHIAVEHITQHFNIIHTNTAHFKSNTWAILCPCPCLKHAKAQRWNPNSRSRIICMSKKTSYSLFFLKAEGACSAITAFYLNDLIYGTLQRTSDCMQSDRMQYFTNWSRKNRQKQLLVQTQYSFELSECFAIHNRRSTHSYKSNTIPTKIASKQLKRSSGRLRRGSGIRIRLCL